MKRKIWIVSIGMSILFVLTSLPTTSLQPIEIDTKDISKVTLASEEETPNILEIKVYQFQKNGSFTETVKKLTFDENKELMDELMQTEISNLTPKEIFEEKLEILKEYELVPDNITLGDILDVGKLENASSQSFNISKMEPFIAHFAPIFIGGFGFGAGFGFRRLPIIRRFAGNIFSIGVIGLGAVLCFDLFKTTCYYQLTFTVPLLVHIISGFVGIMLFAFDSVFPPIPGAPPLTIYSNIVALGVAGLAVGLLVGG